ncbi:hypothetical protein P8452_10048 [Trifolium repens]|nr:hypothetical protein P8452_10048 [Trifolium repens]
MNGGSRNNAEEGEGSGGWASTFLKVAGAVAATAAVAGSLYSILKQPEADVAPYRVQQPDHEEEQVILYVDGSHKPEIPSAACGGYLCNTSGKWICGFTKMLDPNLKLDQTEKEAILSGLCWVREMGKRKVAVFSDREEAVISVKNKSNMDDPLISEIIKVLNSPHWKATLDYIPRKEIGDADKLAEEAHNFTSLDLQHFVKRSDIL